jgi:hypothetical protein
MIWNTIPNEERLRLWKNLREDIKDKKLNEILESVARFCSTIPFGSRSVDYYSPADWPTPWEILFYGSFCTSSISLLIYYTLILLPTTADIELLLVEDDTDVYLLPIIDNQFVLNYELGKVSNYSEIKDDFKILKTYTRNEAKTIT